MAGMQDSRAWKRARTSSGWARFIQAFGLDPRVNEDHQLVLRKRTTW